MNLADFYVSLIFDDLYRVVLYLQYKIEGLKPPSPNVAMRMYICLHVQ